MRFAMRTAFAITLCAAILACAPSLKSLSAGHVGCAESEIEVSDESSSFGSRTWKATCSGAVYHCSKTVTGLGTPTAPAVEHVACTPEAREATAEPTSAPAAKPTQPAFADGDPPSSAGGFDFKMPRALAERRCADAAKQWAPLDAATARCSGAATDVGFAATVDIQFCDAAACALTITSAAPGNTARDAMGQYARLLRALEQKYGTVHVTSRGQHSAECGDAQLEECLSDGFAQLVTQWRWRSGESLTLLLGRRGGDRAAPMDLRIVYRDRAVAGPRLDAL